jgi:hypothetical protein
MQQIAEYKRASEVLHAQIFHIKRNLNGVAHDCGQQAIRQSQSLPTFQLFKFSSQTSRQLCLHNLDLHGIVVHIVLCI